MQTKLYRYNELNVSERRRLYDLDVSARSETIRVKFSRRKYEYQNAFKIRLALNKKQMRGRVKNKGEKELPPSPKNGRRRETAEIRSLEQLQGNVIIAKVITMQTRRFATFSTGFLSLIRTKVDL